MFLHLINILQLIRKSAMYQEEIFSLMKVLNGLQNLVKCICKWLSIANLQRVVSCDNIVVPLVENIVTSTRNSTVLLNY